MGGTSIQWLCSTFSAAETLTANDVIATRWQRPLLRYFGSCPEKAETSHRLGSGAAPPVVSCSWIRPRGSTNCSVFSDRNSACCKGCWFESEGEVCQEPIDATCKGHSYCTGQHTGQRSCIGCPGPGASCLLCYCQQETAASVRPQKTLQMKPCVWTAASVWTGSASRSVRPS